MMRTSVTVIDMRRSHRNIRKQHRTRKHRWQRPPIAHSRGEKCVASGKMMFEYTHASKFARMLRQTHDTNHRAYHCKSCGWFHVGSSISRSRDEA